MLCRVPETERLAVVGADNNEICHPGWGDDLLDGLGRQVATEDLNALLL